MNKIKKYLKPMIFFTIFIIIYLSLLVLLNYFQVAKFSTITTINFVVMAIVTFIFGILGGKNTSKKGYLEGLKLGGIIALFLLFLNLIFIRIFSLSVFLYYLIIVVSSTIGSMIGINLKKK